MKAYTSSNLYDETDRYTGVRETMGQVRLDSEANLQVDITRVDARRRSGDVAEGSPDDGFRITDTHLLDPVLSLDGWTAVGLAADDERVITPQFRLVRREPDTLPHVWRTRGHTAVTRRMPGIDLLRLPVPLHPAGATYAAASIVVQVRFDRPPTDEDIVDVRAVVFDSDGVEHDVGPVPAPEAPDAVQASAPWAPVTVPIAALAPLRRGAGDDETLVLTGWGLRGLPPRATVDVDALLAVDGGLGEGDVVIRGGDGTVTGAGRLFVHGLRTFLEHDWRYSLQPDLPDPPPLVRPTPGPDGSTGHHLIFADVFEDVVRGFSEPRLIETALGGEETAFRTRKVTQIRAVPVDPGGSEQLPGPIGGGRLSTNVPAGPLPDRYPAEEPDPCRDRCLFSINATTGEGYRGSENINVRVEVLVAPTPAQPGVIGWSRDNAARVAPLVIDAAAGVESLFVAPEDARAFTAGGLVVVEDRRSRLDPGRPEHRAEVRALRTVNSATGELELEPAGWTLTTDPVPLVLGGGLSRAFLRSDAAAVRRWDGVDHLLTDVRYNLFDGITFAVFGDDFRVLEHWTFTCRVAGPDAVAEGVVEQLTRAAVAGPRHERVPLARVNWTPTGREFTDLRVRFLPLQEVRDRLIELGARRLAPGAFTVVVGDGRRTFGDIDQDLAEGVTGDEALQAALDRIGAAGGAIYVRAGEYRLEHPVLLQNRSMVRILGDGAASRLQVTGAGGAFHIDGCGAGGEISIELLALAETPDLETPIGSEAAQPAVPRPLGPIIPVPLLPAERPILLTDLVSSVPTAPDLVANLAGRLRDVGLLEARAAGSVVATLTRLRRLQRAQPGRPLEDVAPAELDVLRRLPHGVVTVTDSNRVRLANLALTSREHGQAEGTVAAAVLVSGSCSDVVVDSCRMLAPSGVVAAAYARSFTPAAISLWPRSGLFLDGLNVRDCVIQASGEASHGLRVSDGIINGVVASGNRIDGFARGISLQDAAEVRTAAVDRTVLRDNVISAPLAGITVTGDGAEIDSNEVRLDGPDPIRGGVRAAIQITGVANRVRDNWIELDTRPAPALSVQAAVLVGTGADDGAPVGRPVHDVVIAGNRVDGGGAQACGVLVGGSTPCLDVLVQRNTLRALGDAGVRVWASSGPVGSVRVLDNSISDVAREYLSWGPSVVAEAAELSGAQLPANGSPRDVLDALLALGAGAIPAVDAVLRWLERATLRGGVVLSLAENSIVRGNEISEVGRTAYPAGFVRPGTEIRTAGVAAVGTRDLTVTGNRVRGVRTPVSVTRPPVVPLGPIRPPVLDVLPGLIRPPRPQLALDVFGPAVALRRQIMDYTAGNARERQRLGRGIYTAIESLAGTLEDGGPERRRLAVELQGGLSAMREAQGAGPHTLAAHQVRATLSRTAALTAPDPAVASAWDAAARFDSALAGDPQAADETVAVVRTAAAEVLEGAPGLSAGLEGLGLDAEGDARRVLAGGGTGAQQAKDQATLASTLGTLAEARNSKVRLEQTTTGAALSTADRAAAEGIVQLSLAALDVPEVTELNEQAVERLAQGGAGLTEVLRPVNSPLAERVGTDIARLRAAGGRPSQADVARLTSTLTEVQAFARGEQVEHEVAAADLDAQHETFRSSLIAVTADQIERRVAALEVDPESTASQNLALVEQATAQLGHLVGTDPQARNTARAAQEALGDALSDVDNRAEHQARARTLLRELAGMQGLPLATDAGAATAPAGVGTLGPAAVTAGADLAGPIAGLGELVLALRDTDQPAEVREEAAALLDSRLRAAVDDVGIGPAEAADLLADVTQAIDSAVRGSDAARAAALGGLAAKVETIAYRAAQRADSVPEVRAAHVLSGGLARALDPTLSERERVAAVNGWTASRGEALSTSLATQLTGAVELTATLTGLGKGLDTLLAIPLRPLRPITALAVDTETADGAFVSGAGRRLELADNSLAECRVGISVLGPDGHALAPTADGEALALTLQANSVEAAALGALIVSVPSATAAVVANVATGCCGAHDRAAPEYGQAVVSVSGSGTLLVADNRLRDNGNTRSDAPVHEVLLNWQGDVTVRNNQVRHAGGSVGGYGLAVISGPVPADLVRRLVATPALVAEPVSTQLPQPRWPLEILTGLDNVFSAGLSKTVTAATSARGAAGGPTAIGVGGLQLATRELRPSFSVLTAGIRPVPDTTLAHDAADGWLAATTVDTLPTVTIGPLVGWLRRPLPPLIVLPPPVRRAVQVVGNDVVSAGPALVVLHEGPALVSATVVDNDLESLGSAGALYLRGVDTTVISGNRLESQQEVNVVVLRVRASLVSVTGNTAAGDEPAAPAPPPVPLDIKPLRPDLGDLHLVVPVGDRSSLTLRLDPDAVRTALDEKRVSAFTEVADEAETSFGLFSRETDLALNPEVARILTAGRTAGLSLRRVADRITINPPAAPAEAPDAPGPHVEMAVQTSNAILSSARLSAPAKLFGLAVSSGMPAHQARAFVQSNLLRAGGNQSSALASGLAEITGIDDAAGPTVSERVLAANPVEDLVSLLLRDRTFTPVQPDRVIPPLTAPRPDPRRKSIVVIGGSRVAAVGNVTTAGIHVHDAAHSIENNL